MYAIDNASASGSLQTPAAAGAHKYFEDASSPGTIVSADWANMVQEELLNVVAAGGVESPSKTDYDQVSTAIGAMIAAAIAAIPPDIDPPGTTLPVAQFIGSHSTGTNSPDSLTNGAYTQRTVNTTVKNTVAGCSLASNQVTLPTGLYQVDGWAAFAANTGGAGQSVNCRTRLRDTTNGLTLLDSALVTAVGMPISAAPCMAFSAFSGVITITAATVVEAETWAAGSTGGSGGYASNSTGDPETYVSVTFLKIG